jgi:hypothetical protein
MSHLYPLAVSAKAALETPEHAALTLAQAERLAGTHPVTALETEWLTLTPEEADAAQAAAEAGVGHGFVQTYEDASGAPVLAVTYWKLADATAVRTVPAPITPVQTPDTDDHTDDLYFRSGRTKKRGRRKKIDPNQLDLFNAAEGDA